MHSFFINTVLMLIIMKNRLGRLRQLIPLSSPPVRISLREERKTYREPQNLKHFIIAIFIQVVFLLDISKKDPMQLRPISLHIFSMIMILIIDYSNLYWIHQNETLEAPRIVSTSVLSRLIFFVCVLWLSMHTLQLLFTCSYEYALRQNKRDHMTW